MEKLELKTLKLELSIEGINLILKGLQELPAKESMMMIQEIQTEYNRQLDELNKPPEVTDK